MTFFFYMVSWCGGNTQWASEDPFLTARRGQLRCFGFVWVAPRPPSGTAATQAESHGWVGSRGRPWAAASQTPGTHHASFPRAKAAVSPSPAPNPLGQDLLCQEALNPLKKMPKGAARARPDLQDSGRRWAWEQRRDFRNRGFSPGLAGAGAPERPSRLPTTRALFADSGAARSRLGGASACGQGPAGQGAVAPPLGAPLRSRPWRSSAPCRRQAGVDEPPEGPGSCGPRRRGGPAGARSAPLRSTPGRRPGGAWRARGREARVPS